MRKMTVCIWWGANAMNADMGAMPVCKKTFTWKARAKWRNRPEVPALATEPNLIPTVEFPGWLSPHGALQGTAHRAPTQQAKGKVRRRGRRTVKATVA